jgi:chorismate mutase
MKLESLRDQIDRLDDRIIMLLDKRIQLACKTTQHKNKVHDLSREEQIFQRLKTKTRKLRLLEPEFVHKLYRMILKESRKIQSDQTEENIAQRSNPEHKGRRIST